MWQTCPSLDDAGTKHEKLAFGDGHGRTGIGTKRMGYWEEAVNIGTPLGTPQRSGTSAGCPAFPLHRAKEVSTSAVFL